MTDGRTDPERHPDDDIGRLLPAVGQSWKRLLGKCLADEGLSDATGLPILVLWRAGGRRMRQHELAQQLGLETSGVVRVLDGLGRRGLLRRVEDPSDRRAKLVELTAEGQAMGERVDRVARTLRARLLQAVDPADLAAASRVLAQLWDAIEATEADRNGK
ncbi:MarR family winged helix-turn-helix transcriptional regulator [Mangrovicoccus ximenensis]|uniref:MarR family winged helix-turn-helix transcriptional regulator n=1 Tax=Mangrovicoccus ximenensis TaxID=1911570 RepID=UPI000D36DAFC|nr:winged helix DNA-binding protein [Mangrovicoccus ximenensis]